MSSLRNRLDKIEARLTPSKKQYHILVGSETSLVEQQWEFREQHRDFDGLLVCIIDLFEV